MLWRPTVSRFQAIFDVWGSYGSLISMLGGRNSRSSSKRRLNRLHIQKSRRCGLAAIISLKCIGIKIWTPYSITPPYEDKWGEILRGVWHGQGSSPSQNDPSSGRTQSAHLLNKGPVPDLSITSPSAGRPWQNFPACFLWPVTCLHQFSSRWLKVDYKFTLNPKLRGTTIPLRGSMRLLLFRACTSQNWIRSVHASGKGSPVIYSHRWTHAHSDAFIVAYADHLDSLKCGPKWSFYIYHW